MTLYVKQKEFCQKYLMLLQALYEDENLRQWYMDYSVYTPVTSRKDLNILITEEDKYGADLSAMSNFFDSYIDQLNEELRSNEVVDVLKSLPVTDIGLITEVVQYGAE